MNIFSTMRVSLCALALAVNWCAFVAVGQVNGSEEKSPPATFKGLLIPDSPPPPPPGQPLTANQMRVSWAHLDSGDLRLTVQVVGVPGMPFLLGAQQPGSLRPVVIAAANLDEQGSWVLTRVVSVEHARTLSAVEFVGITR